MTLYSPTVSIDTRKTEKVYSSVYVREYISKCTSRSFRYVKFPFASSISLSDTDGSQCECFLHDICSFQTFVL